jgi:hypothetical protein
MQLLLCCIDQLNPQSIRDIRNARRTPSVRKSPNLEGTPRIAVRRTESRHHCHPRGAHRRRSEAAPRYCQTGNRGDGVASSISGQKRLAVGYLSVDAKDANAVFASFCVFRTQIAEDARFVSSARIVCERVKIWECGAWYGMLSRIGRFCTLGPSMSGIVTCLKKLGSLNFPPSIRNNSKNRAM